MLKLGTSSTSWDKSVVLEKASVSPRKKKEGRERGCADVCKFVYVFACACVCEGKGKIEIQVERSRLVKEGSYPVLQTGMKACLVCICLRLLKPSPSLLSLTALFLLLGVTCLMSSLSAGPEKCPCYSWVWLQYDMQWLCAGIQYSL